MDKTFQYDLEVIPGFVSTIRDSSVITLDGWGTLTTQYGTFQVLRTQERHWITQLLNGGSPTYSQNVSYAWFDVRGITILSYTNPSDSVDFTTATVVAAEMTSSSAELINDIIPQNFQLSQNYPNPFNPNTTIRYAIPVQSEVTIKVYDLLGNEIATLVDEVESAGTYEVTWDAGNVPSGVYFYKVQAGSFIETKKMILLK